MSLRNPNSKIAALCPERSVNGIGHLGYYAATVHQAGCRPRESQPFASRLPLADTRLPRNAAIWGTTPQRPYFSGGSGFGQQRGPDGTSSNPSWHVDLGEAQVPTGGVALTTCLAEIGHGIEERPLIVVPLSLLRSLCSHAVSMATTSLACPIFATRTLRNWLPESERSEDADLECAAQEPITG